MKLTHQHLHLKYFDGEITQLNEMWMWYEEGVVVVAVKSLYSQMHHSTDIISRNEDDVIALLLQKDQSNLINCFPEIH